MLGNWRSWTVALGSMLTLASNGAGATDPMEELASLRLPDVSLADAAGQAHSLTSRQGKRATVLIFQSTECPLSNAYLPTIEKLAGEEAARGVAFLFLNPNEGQTTQRIAEHRAEFGFATPVLLDVGAKVARSLGVTTCPEACLFDATGRLVYRGRIDDRYRRRGGVARTVADHSLKNAIDNLLSGAPISPNVTEPVGCPIFARADASTAGSAASSPPGVTYHEHVAGVLQRNCQQCHRPGGIGPFSLTSYDQAVSWAEDLVAYTADGTMPPWKPAAGHGDFQNVRRMPATEVDILARWVGAGCPQGDASKAPPPVEFPDGWTLGTPDLVIAPDEEYVLAADGEDVYRNFVFENTHPHDLYIAGYEVVPGNRRIVHHVLMFLDGKGFSTKLDERDPGPGYTSALGLPGFIPTGGLGGWAPGNLPHLLEDGMVRILPKGHRIVMQVHYHKTGKVERDRTSVGLYLAKGTPTRAVGAVLVLPMSARLGGMRIPPGDSNYEVAASFHVMRELDAITITPHMHLLGKDMTVTAVLPDGTVRPLIRVDEWDFNWQETYNYASPVRLPAGTRLDLVAHFDNSADNPDNPSRPPKLVTWGEQTTEEMCIAFLEVVPTEEAKSLAELATPDPFDLFRGHIKRTLREMGQGATVGR